MGRGGQIKLIETLLEESWWREGITAHRVLATRTPAQWGAEFHLHRESMNPVMTAHMIQRLYPKHIVGIKAAHYWGDFTQVDKAVEAGKLADVPVMVDFGEHQPPNSIEETRVKPTTADFDAA